MSLKSIAGLSILTIVAFASVLWFCKEKQPALTIAAVGHTPLNETEEKLVVAITNNTASEVSGHLYDCRDPEKLITFGLAPHCGAHVWAYGRKQGPWTIRGDYYLKTMGNREARIRLFLLEHTPLGRRALTDLGGVLDKPLQPVRMEE